MSEACRGSEQSHQLEHYRTKSPDQPFNQLAAWTCDSVKSPIHFVQEKLTLCISYTPYYIQTLIPTKCRELPERILREKPQRKTRLTHPQSSSFDSPNSSTLTLSILTSLRGTLAKTFSHHTHIYKKAIWCLGSSQEGTN